MIGFNGTTEWALDSVENEHAVWLPRETQLRELLAATFRSLCRADSVWSVALQVNGEPLSTEHPDAEQAYGLALLALLRRPASRPRRLRPSSDSAQPAVRNRDLNRTAGWPRRAQPASAAACRSVSSAASSR